MITIKTTEIPQLSRSGRIYNTLTTTGGGSSTTTTTGGNIPVVDLSNYLQLSSTTTQNILTPVNANSITTNLLNSNNTVITRTTGSFDQVWRNTSSTWLDYTASAKSPQYEAFIPFPTNAYKMYVGKANKYSKIYFNFITLAIGQTTTFEYSKGAGVWGVLTVVDNTNNFTVNNTTIDFTPPADWVADSVNGSANYYYIRLGSTTSSSTDANIIYMSSDDSEIFSIKDNSNDKIFAIDQNNKVLINSNIRTDNSMICIDNSVSIEGCAYTSSILGSNGSYIRSYRTNTGINDCIGFSALASEASAGAVVQKAPTLNFNSFAWDGVASKRNVMRITHTPVADTVTSSYLTIKNGIVDGVTNTDELFKIDSAGNACVKTNLNVGNCLNISGCTILNSKVYAPNLTQNEHEYALYYNQTTGQITYSYVPQFIGSGSTKYLVTLPLLTSLGYNAGTGNTNTFIGSCAGSCIYGYGYNTAIGSNAGFAGTLPVNNVMIGHNAGYCMGSACCNVIIGNDAGYLSNGNCNVFIGDSVNYLTGNNNVVIGAKAGYCNTTTYCGCGNVLIGNGAGTCNASINNKLMISNTPTTSPLICGDFGACSVKINGSLEITGDLTHTSTAFTFNNANKHSSFGTAYLYGKKFGKLNYLTGYVYITSNFSTPAKQLTKINNYVSPGNTVYFTLSNYHTYQNANGFIDSTGNVFLQWGVDSSLYYYFNAFWIE